MATFDVMAFGAVGDGVANDWPAIQNVINNAPQGSTILLPAKHRVSQPITLPVPNLTLHGPWAPRWPYDTGQPAYVKPLFVGFTGDAVITVAGVPGCRIRDLSIDGVNATGPGGAPIHGLNAEDAHDLRVDGVGLDNLTGHGLYAFAAAGLVLTDVTAHICRGGAGFRLIGVTDSILTRCLAVANQEDGFWWSDPSDVKLTDCMAVFNGDRGFGFDGNNGSLQLTSCSTDRNGDSGFVFALRGASDAHAVTLVGCYARRDGSRGFEVAGASAARHVPVLMSGCATHVAKGDDGGGVNSPLYGLSVDWGRAVQLSSCSLQGTNAGLSETNGAAVRYGPDTLFNTGTGSNAVWDSQSAARFSAPGGAARLYVEAGALKFKGGAGTVTVLGPA